MSYLKALGVLRLVSEQANVSALGEWRENVFQLHVNLSEETLLDFFLERYEPTPVVVPWSGNDFFAVPTLKPGQTFKKTPAGSAIIAAFRLTTSPRIQAYREAISTCLTALGDAGVKSKDDMKKAVKSRYLTLLRNRLNGTASDWLDAAAVILAEQPKFFVLLGSGGGSDGNTHFSDNFMQNLWEMLSDFDDQRAPAKPGRPRPLDVSRSLLANALFARPTEFLVVGRTSSLFDSGAIGGPNAGQGFERDALANPWNFILALEGAICLAGAATRRFESGGGQQASFPFQVFASSTGLDSLAQKEEAGREVWMPQWTKPTHYREVRALLAEGRLSNHRWPARTGVDAARAAASLGVDRGIAGFYRYAIVKGRVGGDNYNTAAFLGAFPVRLQRRADLLGEIEPWLASFRKRCQEKENEEDRNKGNARFTRALRGIERAVVNYCRYGDREDSGDRSFFQAILLALGAAERELITGANFRHNSQTNRAAVSPLVIRSADWLAACADATPEFHLALSLAGIYDANERIGPVRVNLEPVVPGKGRAGNFDWADRDRAAVWNGADLAADLLAVLLRRQMDATRVEGKHSPFAFRHPAPVDAIARFLAGETDDARLDALLAGLILLTPGRPPADLPPLAAADPVPPLPRAYALLKLLFLPFPLELPHGSRVRIPTEPSVPALLQAGRVPEACRLAMRRLRASGLRPLPHRVGNGRNRDDAWEDATTANLDGRRLAAALLFPVSEREATHRLARLALRPGDREDDAFTDQPNPQPTAALTTP